MMPTTVDLILDGIDQSHQLRVGQAHAGPSQQHGVLIRVDLTTQDPELPAGVRQIDPDLGSFPGAQYPTKGSPIFGFLQDISPDRWGRCLMDRRRSQDRRHGRTDLPARLTIWDYLLGVDDRHRLGAVRLQEPGRGWLAPPLEIGVPPLARLRTLEEQARRVEDDPDGELDEDVRLLMAPGSSLGGARPKAVVSDEHGKLWIAKFPSTKDTDDVGLWEALTNALARTCGIDVPNVEVQRIGGRHHVVRSLRFDRTPTGGRVHVASAMTLTGHHDGDGAQTGASYLELARVLTEHGATPARCLPELWRRIVFNMLVSNADDHLRNHAFLLRLGQGWELAPAYDMNPMPGATGLALNVSDADNTIDVALARSVAAHFRVGNHEAADTIARMRSACSRWRSGARALGASAAACDRMAQAFAQVDGH
jgi:serine/threonine-protein kinase HipA